MTIDCPAFFKPDNPVFEGLPSHSFDPNAIFRVMQTMLLGGAVGPTLLVRRRIQVATTTRPQRISWQSWASQVVLSSLRQEGFVSGHCESSSQHEQVTMGTLASFDSANVGNLSPFGASNDAALRPAPPVKLRCGCVTGCPNHHAGLYLDRAIYAVPKTSRG